MLHNKEWQTIPGTGWNEMPGDLGPINIGARGAIGVWWKDSKTGRYHCWNRWHDGSVWEASGRTMSEVRKKQETARKAAGVRAA